ncbi:LANO_0F08284g1_1 [Lachancea nothofagi CBS 11611]|uniref:LANO_0F08284g1_1 n=1 Tax=Lachancea nothofagi CBS 11611 TaxID=1266666 RepID=A0A1G4K9B4_9SACH|nr:LANO_0F08284g1_1 [Lachancea nothofagi CBS 11611]
MHQPQLSINSVQSLVEPTTPPLGQMSNRQNHQRTHSLDLSGFNQFIQGNSPMMPMSLSPGTPPVASGLSGGSLSATGGVSAVANAHRPKLKSLPLINEFNPSFSVSSTNDGQISMPMRTVSGSTTSSSASMSHSHSNSQSNSGAPADLNWTPLEELDYVKLATDQFGCRFLQKKLETPQECCTVRDLMYRQVSPFFLELILDPFGNYLVQKLCECLTTDQKTQLIEKIYPHVFQISINQYGTRSLQKIIDTVDTEAQIDLIVSGFGQNHTSIDQIVALINDLNGNHVVQKCIFKFPPTKFDFIIDAIVDQNNIVKISTHKHGCCVLQKLLSVCTLQQIFKISVKIIQFLRHLINDQFGNYIIQFLLDIRELDFYLLGELFDKLSTEMCQLSCLKFSSNVVEKFIKKLFTILKFAVVPASAKNKTVTDDVIMVAMRILIKVIDIFTANLNVLIRDNFGNYALQTLLDVKNYSKLLQYPNNTYVHTSANTLNFSREFTVKVGNLVVLTKELLPSIKTTSYAKKIKIKVKAYAELTGLIFNDPPATKGGNASNPHQNNHRKQHARHCSLPANTYRHRRNSSSLSLSSGYPMFQPPQQHITQPLAHTNSAFGNSSQAFPVDNVNHAHTQNFYSAQNRPMSVMYNQQPEGSRFMDNSFVNVPNAAIPANNFAYNDPRLLQMPEAQENIHTYTPNGNRVVAKSSESLYANGNNYENINYGGIFY